MSAAPARADRTPAADVDLAFHLGHAAANTRYEDLSPAAVEAARKSVLDLLGVVLAASGMEPAIAGPLDLLQQTGGRPEATIVSRPGRYPATAAAFANGAMAHCLDFDDLTPWGHHCSSSIVPAVLAVAERTGGVDGRDVLTAVAVGQDLFTRLRRNIDWRREWHLSCVFGVYAAAAGAGRMMGLSPEQITHALGIASMRSAGLTEMIAGTGSDLHGMYAGFSAEGAVSAVLLAQHGMTGIPRLFEGDHGIFAGYFRGTYDRAAILEDLGKDFRGADTLYKAWPCVGTVHSHIQAVIDLVRAHDVAADEIQEIQVHVGDYHALSCTPLEARRAPVTRADAQYSLPYLAAIAAIRHDVTVADFTEEAIRDQQVLRLAARVVPVPDPALDWHTELPPGRVRITLADGRVLEAVGDRVPGSAANPLGWEDLVRKFRTCAAMAVVDYPDTVLDEVPTAVQTLEASPDASSFVSLLAAPAEPRRPGRTPERSDGEG
jgi:2-methylcitrate dehydratase PrpD